MNDDESARRQLFSLLHRIEELEIAKHDAQAQVDETPDGMAVQLLSLACPKFMVATGIRAEVLAMRKRLQRLGYDTNSKDSQARQSTIVKEFVERLPDQVSLGDLVDALLRTKAASSEHERLLGAMEDAGRHHEHGRALGLLRAA